MNGYSDSDPYDDFLRRDAEQSAYEHADAEADDNALIEAWEAKREEMGY